MYTIDIAPSTVLLITDAGSDSPAAKALRECGAASSAVVACDPGVALQYLQASGPFAGQNPSRPQLLLVEIAAVCAEGENLVKEARKHSKAPILVLTLQTPEEEVNALYLAGASSVIQCATRPLNETMATALQYWLTLNRSAETVT